MGQKTIYVIEDEESIREVLQVNLELEGFKVASSADGLDGLRQVRERQPALVLLDLMLPGLDGLEICRLLKSDEHTKHIPIIIVTAKGKESDVVLGLGLGASDYITKPFRLAEVIARVKAIMRDASPSKPATTGPQVLQYGELVIDPLRHEIWLAGQLLEFTATEFRLVHFLGSHPGRVFSRIHLINECIGDDVFVSERTIDTHLGTVRKKLGHYRDMIKTVWGVGYRFADILP
jgi:two-component system, OmpR family, alkaline phosphatase synthesis response regulator PhoP